MKEDGDREMDNECAQKTECGKWKTESGNGEHVSRVSSSVLRLPGSFRRFSSFVPRPSISVRGFTFLELIVVLAIISVTAAMVIPRVGSSMKQIDDHDFLQKFTQAINRSRLYAMNSGRPIAFRMNGTERVYGTENTPREPIPLNTEIYSEHLQKDPETGDYFIIFHPDGSLVGNDIEIVFDHERTYHIFIHPLFGTVSLARMK